jgi:hypothetical protein
MARLCLCNLRWKTSLCGIEQAIIKAQLMENLFPVIYILRIKDFTEFAVNYDKWDICDPACSLGQELEVPVYKFVKEAF